MKPYEARVHEGVKFYIVPALEALHLVHHGFSTRVGGVSTGPFKAMNLALNVGEDNDLVEINRCMFAKALNAGNPEIYTVNQVHGTKVLRLENREHPLEEVRETPADAIITDQPGVAIGVLTADCVPILLVDPVKRAVAAVHAGREGSLRSILSRVIQKMVKDFHSSPQDLHAAVGPSVETGCYEVGDEVVVRVQDRYKHRREVLVRNHGATYLDLRKINHFDLLENGLSEDRIYHLPLCTACHSRTFYSYRKRRGQETGRMMALIMLRED